MSAGLFFQLLACAILLAIFMVGMSGNRISSLDFILAAYFAMMVMSSTYGYSYFSEKVTSDLASIGEAFYQSNWYECPVNQQKIYIVSIQRAQNEFRTKGLGLVECSLRVYSSVGWTLMKSF